VNREIIRYQEPLSPDELDFLRRKVAQDKRQFYKVLRVLLVLSFVCPFIVAWIRAFIGVPNPFSYGFFFLGVGFLLAFSATTAYVSYYYFLRKVVQDLRANEKIIERAHITGKRYMPQTNSYHFYLDSPTRLSIEVSEPDYKLLKEGDEVNIEYTTVSKMYLGYF